MKRRITNVFAAVFAAAALAFSALAVYLCASRIGAAPVLLSPAGNAQSRAVSFLDAVCQGSYEDAQALLLGTPELGVDRPAQSEVGVLVWDAFVESLSYTLLGECYATDSGIAQDVQLAYLDIDAATADLRQRAEAILSQLQQTTEEVSDLYDRDNNYREDVVMQVVYTAAQQALAENARTVTTTLTLEMICLDGEWWIVPDETLLQAISGGLAEEARNG